MCGVREGLSDDIAGEPMRRYTAANNVATGCADDATYKILQISVAVVARQIRVRSGNLAGQIGDCSLN
jgi:hypothetical protein